MLTEREQQISPIVLESVAHNTKVRAPVPSSLTQLRICPDGANPRPQPRSRARHANASWRTDTHDVAQPHGVAVRRRRRRPGSGVLPGLPVLPRLLAADHRPRVCAPGAAGGGAGWRGCGDVLSREHGAVDRRPDGGFERVCVDVDLVLWTG
jgi:hypothetical protein